ncbi:helix-turn-helix domain-containing protein [Paenibacillus thailandensis]|uniref:Helix-turn-helix domain-containing protein n=1 Tax=Paenibacillus thailandensis TaxID=393250 RepID=A0ABW5QZA5_9BACL
MKALIVDDEARVRKAVRLLVDWEEHGISDIAEAENGSEAVRYIEAEKPAVVIMDMMMPEFNGIDLMSWVSENANTVKFIVVSGHNDFDFVRQTVRNGGIDYLLKPIEPDAINAAVAKAVREWREEEARRISLQKNNIQLNELKPIYSEKLLTGIVDEPGQSYSAIRRLQEEGVLPPSIDKARIALLQADISDEELYKRFGYDSELLYYCILNICNEFVMESGCGIAFRYWSEPSDMIVLVWSDFERLETLIRRINDGLYRTLGRRMHFGLSETADFPARLAEQYSQASGALWDRNVLDAGLFVHRPANEPKPAPSAEGSRYPFQLADWEEDWRTAIVSGHAGQIAEACGRWRDAANSVRSVTPRRLVQWTADIELFTNRLLRERLGAAAEAARSRLEDAAAFPYPGSGRFSREDWLAAIERWMNETARVINDLQGNETTTIGDIVAYIKQHYQLDLSLQDIAGRFHVSREYVSRKFKQEYGITLTDFITELRMDHAKRLMLNPQLKIAQIAEMVGFHDEKYFSKVFKKLTGLSPSAYRQETSAEHLPG